MSASDWIGTACKNCGISWDGPHAGRYDRSSGDFERIRHFDAPLCVVDDRGAPALADAVYCVIRCKLCDHVADYLESSNG